MASTAQIPNNVCSLYSSFLNHNRAKALKWKRHQETNLAPYRRSRGQVFQVLANPNASQRKGGSDDVVMVDPLEAKRLAAKQMQQLQARDKLKRQRRIEAINGAWAMIGLTAGLIIEGHTGKSILNQLADYWNAIFHFFLH